MHNNFRTFALISNKQICSAFMMIALLYALLGFPTTAYTQEFAQNNEISTQQGAPLILPNPKATNKSGSRNTNSANTNKQSGQPQLLPERREFISSGWIKSCFNPGPSLADCTISLTTYTKTNKDQKPIKIVSYGLQFDKNGEPVSQIVITPLQTLLRRGVRIKIGNHPRVTSPYTLCSLNGCTALWPADKITFERLKNEKDLLVAYHNLNDVQVRFELPLLGFTKASQSRGRRANNPLQQ